MESASGWIGEGNLDDPPDQLALGELELFGIPVTDSGFRITDFSYDVTSDRFRFTWGSLPDEVYSLRWSTDMENWENALATSIPSEGETTSFPPEDDLQLSENPSPEASRIFFRIEIEDN